MADQQIVMSVPQDIIKAQIQAAVVSALNKDPEALVRAVVDAAMSQRKDSYDKTTIWDLKVNEMIRQESLAAAAVWIDGQKPAIRAEVAKRLNATKSKIVSTIIERLIEALTSKLQITIHTHDLTEKRY